MDVLQKTFETKNGNVEGVHVKWENFSILMVTGSKACLCCGVFDIDAFERFDYPAALVNSSPENPIGSLENFPNRTIKAANQKAKDLGVVEGLDVQEAFALIA